MTDAELMNWYDKASEFHTKRAPGLLIGAALIDAARSNLKKETGKINAVSESVSCLCDIIQLMTGCTMGNRYLRAFPELGRYALTLFDRDTGCGIRASVALDKICADETPELHRFFLRKRGAEVKAGGPARLESGKKVVAEFLRVRDEVIAIQHVAVKSFGKPPMPSAARCAGCHESFLQTAEESLCGVCSGSVEYFTIKKT